MSSIAQFHTLSAFAGTNPIIPRAGAPLESEKIIAKWDADIAEFYKPRMPPCADLDALLESDAKYPQCNAFYEYSETTVPECGVLVNEKGYHNPEAYECYCDLLDNLNVQEAVLDCVAATCENLPSNENAGAQSIQSLMWQNSAKMCRQALAALLAEEGNPVDRSNDDLDAVDPSESDPDTDDGIVDDKTNDIKVPKNTTAPNTTPTPVRNGTPTGVVNNGAQNTTATKPDSAGNKQGPNGKKLFALGGLAVILFGFTM